MSLCTIEWMIWFVVMIAFVILATTGRWTELGFALVITGVLWYTWLPSRQSR